MTISSDSRFPWILGLGLCFTAGLALGLVVSLPMIRRMQDQLISAETKLAEVELNVSGVYRQVKGEFYGDSTIREEIEGLDDRLKCPPCVCGSYDVMRKLEEIERKLR